MTGERNDGGVIWICGLSGVGKTTLATEVIRLMQAVRPNVPVTAFDGDDFRKQYIPHAGYQRDDRLSVARALSKAAWLSAQEGRVSVVSTISLFTEIHERNRERAQALRLPFVLSLISAPAEQLLSRRATLMRDATDVVGIDIKAEMPDVPDHQFTNDGDVDSLYREAIQIIEIWRARRAQLVHLPS